MNTNQPDAERPEPQEISHLLCGCFQLVPARATFEPEGREFDKPASREPAWTPRAKRVAVPSGERGTSGRSPRAISPGARGSKNSTESVDYCVRSGGFELPRPPQAVREFDRPASREPAWTPRAKRVAVPSGERGTSGRSPRAISPGAR